MQEARIRMMTRGKKVLRGREGDCVNWPSKGRVNKDIKEMRSPTEPHSSQGVALATFKSGSVECGSVFFFAELKNGRMALSAANSAARKGRMALSAANSTAKQLRMALRAANSTEMAS